MSPVDRYTKALLTIIAGALVYIAAMLSGERAQAQSGAGEVSTRPQPVVVVGWEARPRALPVVIESTTRPVPVAVQPMPQPLPVTLSAPPSQPLPVTLSGTPSQAWPVTLTGIRAGSEWDEIRVRAQQRTTSTPGIP
jgi:hypothetical protein